MRLTSETVQILDRTADRLGRISRASVVELLARLYAEQLQLDTTVPLSATVPGARKSRRKRGTKVSFTQGHPKPRGS
jgi:hypothetical protein